MAQSLSNVLLHMVFSTKERRPMIFPEHEVRLHSYIKTLCEERNSPLLQIGGMPDHIHMLVCLSKNMAVSEFTSQVKAHSSKFMKSISEDDFSWQNGYGAFSIGESGRENTIQYIVNQKEHHKKMTFKEEFVSFLKKYQIKYDDKYLWN